jgi:hypothetical protein
MPIILSLLGGGWNILKLAGAWLSHRSLAEIGCLVLALVCVVEFVSLKAEKRHSAKVEARLVNVTAARAADRQAYIKAQDDAAVKNKAEVAATEQQYKRSNDEAVSNLNARLAQLRAELLRKAAPGAAKGSAGNASPPKADDSRGSAPTAGVCLTPEELLRAAENEERHDQLIKLIRKQMAVPSQ